MMASIATEDLISELERRYLECTICTEIFNEEDRLPRLLPCQHTFCSLCLKKLCRKESVKCPACNANHKLGKHGLIELPKDNVRRDLTSFLQTQEITLQLFRCSRCGNSIKIDVCYSCTKCKVLFCQVCRKIHQNQKPSHDLKVKSSDKKDEIPSDVCQNSDHENAPLKYFCTSCQISVCPMCALSEHRDTRLHNLEDISQAFNAKKTSMTTSLFKLRQKIQSAILQKEKCKDFEASFQNQHARVSEKIDALFKKGVRILNQQKQKLQTSNSTSLQLQQQNTFEKKEKIDNFIINAEECYSLSEQMIQRKNMTSFLHVHKTLENHIEMFLNESVENIENHENLDDIEEDCDFKMFEKMVQRIDEMTKHDGLNDMKGRAISQRIQPTQSPTKQTFVQKIRHHFPFLNRRRHDEHTRTEVPDRKYECLYRTCDCLMYTPVILILIWAVFANAPAHIFFQRDFFTELKFSIHPDSDFQCRSIDNKTVSLMNSTDMICGIPGKHFRNFGVFANITLSPNKTRQVDFTIRVQTVARLEDLHWVELFQFGFVEDRNSDKYTIMHGIICPVQYGGIRLSMDSTVIDTSDSSGAFTKMDNTLEGKFRVTSSPKDSSIYVFATTFYKTLIFKVKTFEALRPFFVANKLLDVPIFMNFDSKDEVEFDRSTLFPSLFISDDSKIVSTTSSRFLKPRVKSEARRSIYAPLIGDKITGPNIRSVVVVNFTHSIIQNITELFEIGFGYVKKGKCIPFTKFKIIKCKEHYFVENGNTSSELEYDKFRMVLHYNSDKGVLKVMCFTSPLKVPTFNSYHMKGNYRLPVLFLRNIDAADILAYWSRDAYLHEATFSFLYDFV